MFQRILVAFFLLLVLSPFQPKPAAAAGELFFPETGYRVGGRFLEYWQQHGGLAQFGFPISETFTERDAQTGGEHMVQYFERNRFELHSANDRHNDVLLGRLGAQSLELRGIDWRHATQITSPQNGCQFFTETQHNVCDPFLGYWKSHGGLSIFGLPLSEARVETSPTDGKQYLTQHFERNRFEQHPELGQANNILLGLLGSELYTVEGINPTALEVIDLLNAERRKAGVRPVRLSRTLTSVAQGYSTVQAQQGAISHVGPDGSNAGQRLTHAGYTWQRYGENLAAGQRDAHEVMQAWMNSTGHRDNMLHPDFREVGIGLTHRENDPSNYVDYWVMELGTPR